MTRQEISEFYREHHRRLYNISLRILRDSGEAEEVMQDTLLKFLSAPDGFDSPARVSAWLARTCIRASIDRLRRRQRRNLFLKDYALQKETLSPEEEPDGALPDITQVRKAMDALPEPYRLVLDLVLVEGLDYGEIAALTGRKETTLRSLYARGRCKLIEMLKKI